MNKFIQINLIELLNEIGEDETKTSISDFFLLKTKLLRGF
jgi:hypothetical protein